MCTIRLKDDRWTSETADPGKAGPRLSPMCSQFHRALIDALAISDAQGRTTRAAWYAECARVGLAEPVVNDDTSAVKRAKGSSFRKYVAELKAAGLVGIDGEVVVDLRRKAQP